MADIRDLLEKLWDDYVKLNPHALKVHKLLEAHGEAVVNDHIAFRTYDDPRINVDALASTFVHSGYERKGEYTFMEKKLFARHFEHPDATLPKIFISELIRIPQIIDAR